MTNQTTLVALATEVNPSDPGAGQNEVLGFLGHLTDSERAALLDGAAVSAVDAADVRAYMVQA